MPNKDKDKEVVSTQWEMGDVEKAGLLKMDFLGLRNLTSLDAAVRLDQASGTGKPLDLFTLPLDDQATYKLLQRGEAKGVFQLDGAGIRDLLVKMKPDRFADLIAILALYRPGPLNGGMVDEYVDVKHGRKQPIYPHPVMKEVLEETYGVMVYQEQVMRILNRLGGIELSQAYACIKAISKKKTEVIAQGKKQFVEGADRARAGEGPGREDLRPDRVSSAATASTSRTRPPMPWSPTRRPTSRRTTRPSSWPPCSPPRWTAPSARSTSSSISTTASGWASRSCRPTSTQGESMFKVAAEGKIHFGLGAIKGVGFKAVEAIVEARDAGGTVPRASIDLFERVPPSVVSQACVEALIKAGAFDCLGAKRSQWLAVLPRAAQGRPSARRKIASAGSAACFDIFEPDANGNGRPTAMATVTQAARGL